VRNAAFDHLDVTFNEPIDPATFTTQDVAIAGPDGLVSVTGVAPLAADTFRVTFPALTTRGAYVATVGPHIADLSGNEMDQNQNGTQGETPGDQFTARATLIKADTIFTTSTTINEANTQYDGQDIAIVGATVAIDGPHNFRSILLVGGAVLTHTANTAAQVHGLDVRVTGGVVVDATSSIDVSGKGYAAGRTTGNTPGAGSHGGLGGGSGTPAYDDYADPDDSGAGGNTTAGGGRVRIVAATLTLDGRILADGQGPGQGLGTESAGGAISIAVATLGG
jgi:hypothetical protein